MMTDSVPGEYAQPVSSLLPLGEPEELTFAEWPDYVVVYDLTAEHIPDLKRLVMDETYMQPEYLNRPESFAFIHAIRALGQLRDEFGLAFLLELAETEQDSDWIWEQLPYAISLFGPSALPHLEASLEKTKQSITSLTLVDCVEKMAEVHPETRDACIALLKARLEQAADNDEALNGTIISTLVDWKAMETAARHRARLCHRECRSHGHGRLGRCAGRTRPQRT